MELKELRVGMTVRVKRPGVLNVDGARDQIGIVARLPVSGPGNRLSDEMVMVRINQNQRDHPVRLENIEGVK